MTFQLKPGIVLTSLAFSPDGKEIAIGFSCGRLALYDRQSLKRKKTFQPHTGVVSKVLYSPDGELVITGSWDQTLHIQSRKSRKQALLLKGHTEAIFDFALTRRWDRVVSGGVDGTVRIWDARTGKQLALFKGHQETVTGVTISPDGRWACTCGMVMFEEVESDTPRRGEVFLRRVK